MNPGLLLATVSLALVPPLARCQDAQPPEERVQAIERMLMSGGDVALADFARGHLAPAYRESFEDERALVAHLAAVREAVAPVGALDLGMDGARLRVRVHNRERVSTVMVAFEDAPPHRITELVLASREDKPAAPKMRWETLEAQLEDAASKGFCGSVLALRAGEVVLDRGFGHADPERRHAVTPDTLFAIGSTPIDFTHGAILLLEQRGLLKLSEPLTVFFDDVPADKRGITLEHLRTGRSGLLDFPGIPGVDENLDLSWIDRDEFLRRVFASELLFAPGSDERHSHVAWGLLAAVIEVASDQDYESFLRENFFEPAEMQRTGHYPLAGRFPAGEVAVGLGGNLWGEVNSPQHWGESSWLVLGSGGMVSTTGDLLRWRRFLRGGQVLGAAALAKYGVTGVTLSEGGNDRGFINTIGARGEDVVIVCSNSQVGIDDLTARVALAAAMLGAGD